MLLDKFVMQLPLFPLPLREGSVLQDGEAAAVVSVPLPLSTILKRFASSYLEKFLPNFLRPLRIALKTVRGN